MIVKKETSDQLLDASLVQGTYGVYQLPTVKIMAKLGFALSFALYRF
jgi:hypothetical protein